MSQMQATNLLFHLAFLFSLIPSSLGGNDAVSLWEYVNPVGFSPPGRFGHGGALFAENGEIFMFGGSSSGTSALSDAWVFSLVNSIWQAVPRIDHDIWPSARSMMTIERLGVGIAFMFGGLLEDGTILRDSWIFDRQFMIWRSAAPRVSSSSSHPPARYGHTMVMASTLVSTPGVEGDLILFGGTTTDQVLGDVWILRKSENVTDLIWQEIHTLEDINGAGRPTVSGHSAITFQNSMFIFGGHDQSRVLTNTVWSLTWANSQRVWTWARLYTTGGPPTPRINHRSVMVGAIMIMHGGEDGGTANNGIVSDSWSFDPLTFEWKSLDNSQGKILNLAKHCMVSVSTTYAVTFGGLDSTLSASSLMYSLPRHPLDAIWTRLSPTPDPILARAGHISGMTPNVTIGDDNYNLFVIGGVVYGGSRSADLQILRGDCIRFDSSVPRWEEITLHPAEPGVLPGAFAFAQSYVMGQWLVLYGGGAMGTNLWAIDTRGLTWNQIYPSNFDTIRPVSRWKHSCDVATDTDTLYCFGGQALVSSSVASNIPNDSLSDVWALSLDRLRRNQGAPTNLMASFDGQNDIINIDLSKKPIVFTNAVTMTLEIWFVISDVSADCTHLVTLTAAQSPFLICLDYSSGRLRFVGQDRSLPSTLAPFPRVDQGLWHHVALVIDTTSPNVGSLYIDGNLCINSLAATLQDLTVTPAISITRITVGGYVYDTIPYTIPIANSSTSVGLISISSQPFWYGCVDELRVWSVARNQSDIRGSMYLLAGQLDPSSFGLQGFWNFDKNIDAIFRSQDASPYRRDAIAGDGVKFSSAPTFSASEMPLNQSELSDKKWYTTAWVQLWPPSATTTEVSSPVAPSPRHSSAMTILSKRLFVFGGVAINLNGTSLPCNEVWIFDIASSSWTQHKYSLDYPVAGLTSLLNSDSILLLGGFNSSDQYSGNFNLTIFDLKTQLLVVETDPDNLLTQTFGISIPIAYHTLMLHDGSYYVFGGMANTMLSSAIFTLNVDDYTQPYLTRVEGTAPILSSRSLSPIRSDTNGRYFFSIGGLETYSTLDVVPDSSAVFAAVNPWRFDEAETRWSSIPATNFVRGIAGHSVAYFDQSDDLLVHGGYRLQADGSVVVSSETQAVSMTSGEWTTPTAQSVVRNWTDSTGLNPAKFTMMMPLCDSSRSTSVCGVKSLGTCSQDSEPSISANVDSGRWIAVWHASISDYGTDSDIFYSISDDSGKSWSDVQPLNQDAHRDSAADTHPRISTAGTDGNFRVVWQSSGRLTSDASTDIFTSQRPFINPYVFCGFPSSALPISINFPATKGVSSELGWALSGSSLFAMWREGTGGERLRWSVSVDGAQTWSSSQVLQQSTGGSKPSLVALNGTVLAAWEETYLPSGASVTSTRASVSIFPVVSPFLFCTSKGNDSTHITNVGNDASGLLSASLTAGADGLFVIAYTTKLFQVKVAISLDGGTTFLPPVRLDESHCAGQDVSAKALNQSVVVAWTCSRTNEIQTRWTNNRGTKWGSIITIFPNGTNSIPNVNVFITEDSPLKFFVFWDGVVSSSDERDVTIARTVDAGVTWYTTRMPAVGRSSVSEKRTPSLAWDGGSTFVSVWSGRVLFKANLTGTFPSESRFTDCRGSSCRLEVQNSVGYWGTVCPASTWSAPGSQSTEATLICTQLGFSGIGRWFYEDKTLASNLPDSAFLEGFTCSGDEPDFLSCAHPTIGLISSQACDSHSADIRISCDICNTRMYVDGSGQVVCDYRYSDSGTDAEISSSISTDYGQTWSQPRVVNSLWRNDTGNDVNPSVVFFNGTFIVLWESNESSSNSGPDFDLVLSRSEDGIVWGDMQFVNTNAKTDTNGDDDLGSNLIQVGNSLLVSWLSSVSLGGTLGADVDYLVSESLDGGITWTDPLTANRHALVTDQDDGNDTLPVQTAIPGGGVVTGFYSVTARSLELERWSKSISQIRQSVEQADSCLLKMFSQKTVISDQDNPRNLDMIAVTATIAVSIWDTGTDVFVSSSRDKGRTWSARQSLIHSNLNPLVLPNVKAKVRRPTLASNGKTVIATYHHIDLVSKCGLTGTPSAVTMLGNCQGLFCAALVRTPDGRWGTICDDSWDRNALANSNANSKVVCSAVGLSVAPSSSYKKKFGASADASLSLVLGQVDCNGNETNIDSCSRGEYDSTTCSSSSTIAVSCCGPIAGDMGIGSDSDILYSRSEDGGETWIGPTLLNSRFQSDTGSDYFPDVATQTFVVNGVIEKHWMIVWESLRNTTLYENWDIFISFSRDDGKTFSEPKSVSSNYVTSTASNRGPKISVTADGRWTIVYLTNDDIFGGSSGPDTDSIILESRDSGQTWSSPATLLPDAMVDTESTLILSSLALPDSNIFAVESSTGEIRILRHSSAVMGRKELAIWDSSLCVVDLWSPPVPLISAVHSTRTRLTFDTLPSIFGSRQGTYVVVWQSTNAPQGGVRPYSGNTGSDLDIFFVRSSDSGSTWGAAAPLSAIFLTDRGDDRRAIVRTDGIGGWIVAWESFATINGQISVDLDIYIATSSDDGVTFSTPRFLNSVSLNDAQDDTSCFISYNDQGRWMATWETYANSDYDVLYATSSDGGRTWSPQMSLSISSASRSENQQRARSSGYGEVWMLTYETSAITYEIRTLDNGLQWSDPVALGITSTSASSKSGISGQFGGSFYSAFVTCTVTCSIGFVRTLPSAAPSVCPNRANLVGSIPNSVEPRAHISLRVAQSSPDTMVMIWRGDTPLDSLGLSLTTKTSVILFTTTGVSGFKPAHTLQPDGTINTAGVVFSQNNYEYSVAYGGNKTWAIMLVNDTSRDIGAATRQISFAIGTETSDGNLLVSIPRKFHPAGPLGETEETPYLYTSDTEWVVTMNNRNNFSRATNEARMSHSYDRGATWTIPVAPSPFPWLRDSYDSKVLRDNMGRWVFAFTSTAVGGDEDILVQHKPYISGFTFCDPRVNPSVSISTQTQFFGGVRNITMFAVTSSRVVALFESSQDVYSSRMRTRSEIWMLASNDGGATWPEKSIVTNTFTAESNPTISSIDSQNTLLAAWIVYNTDEADASRPTLFKNGNLALSHRPYLSPVYICSSDLLTMDGPDLTGSSGSFGVAGMCSVVISIWASNYDASTANQLTRKRIFFAFSVDGGNTWILGGHASTRALTNTLCDAEDDPTAAMARSGGGSTTMLPTDGCSTGSLFYSAVAWVRPQCVSDKRVYVGVTSFADGSQAFTLGPNSTALRPPFIETYVSPLITFTSVRRPALCILMGGAFASPASQRIVVAFEVTGAWGSDIDLAFSTRDGDGAWTKPAALNSDAHTERLKTNDFNVRLATDGIRLVVAVWQKTSALTGMSSVSLSRSVDAGTSWSTPILFSPAISTWNDSNPFIICDNSGTKWLLLWDSSSTLNDTGSDRDLLYSFSADSGQTWTTPSFVNDNAESDLGDDFLPKASFSVGKFVCVWSSAEQLGGRVNSGNNTLISEFSIDSRTWSPVKALNPDSTNFETLTARGPPSIIQTGPGETMVSYSQSVLKTISWNSTVPRCQAKVVNAWSSPAILVDGDLLNPALVSTQSGWAVAAAVSVLHSDISLRRIITASSGGYQSVHSWLGAALTSSGAKTTVPRMVAFGSQIILVYHRQGLSSAPSSSNLCGVFAARSLTAGATWTAPKLISNSLTNCNSDYFPDVATNGAGRWMVVWQSVRNATRGRNFDIAVAVSTDDGVSFSAPRWIGSGYYDRGDDTAPRIAYSGITKTWTCVWMSSDSLMGRTGIDSDVFVSESADDGVTWSSFGALNPAASTDSATAADLSVSVVATQSGFVASMECCSNGAVNTATNITLVHWSASMASAVSTQTTSDSCVIQDWSPPHVLNSGAAHDIAASADRSVDIFAHPNSSVIVAVWQSSDPSSYGPTGADLDIISSVSHDGGISWSQGAPVNSWAFTDSGEDRKPRIKLTPTLHFLCWWLSDSDKVTGVDSDIFASKSDTGEDQSWSENIIFNEDAEIDSCFESDVWLFETPVGADEASTYANATIGLRGIWSCTESNRPLSTLFHTFDIFQKSTLDSLPGKGLIADCFDVSFEQPTTIWTSASVSGSPRMALAAGEASEYHTLWTELSATDGICRLFHQVKDDVGMIPAAPFALDAALPSALGGMCSGFQQRISTANGIAVAIWRNSGNIWSSNGHSINNVFKWSTPVALTVTGLDQNPDLAGLGSIWVAVWDSTADYLGQPCCKSDIFSLGSDPDVLYSISTDSGSTWSYPQPLSTTFRSDDATDNFPSVSVDSRQVFLVTFQSNVKWVGSIFKDSDIDILSSTFDSKVATVSWTYLFPVNGNAASDSSADTSVRCVSPGEGWVCTWQSKSSLQGWLGGEGDILFAYSIDQNNPGKRWTAPTPLNTNAETDSGVDVSPTLTVDSQNRLLCVWTVSSFGNWVTKYGPSQRVFGATSLDSGRSWSAPRLVDISSSGDSWNPIVVNTTNGFRVGWITGAENTSPRSIRTATWEPLTRRMRGVFENFANKINPVLMSITSFGSFVDLSPPWALNSSGTFAAPIGSNEIDFSLSIPGHSSTVVLSGIWKEIPNFSITIEFGTVQAVPQARTKAASTRMDVTASADYDPTLLVYGGVDDSNVRLSDFMAFRRKSNTWLNLVCFSPTTLLPIANPSLSDATLLSYQTALRAILVGIAANGRFEVWLVDSLREWTTSKFGLQGFNSLRCNNVQPSGTASAPVAIKGHSVTLYSGRLIVVGGYGSDSALLDIYSFNMASATWVTLPRIGGSAGLSQIYAPIFATTNGVYLFNSGIFPNVDADTFTRNTSSIRFHLLDLSSAVPQLCVATGSGIASSEATQLSLVTISALNAFYLPASRRKLTLDLTGVAILKGKLDSSSTFGIYVLSYRAQLPGVYVLNIKVGDIHISNSPITVQVQPGQTEIKSTTASGALTSSIAGVASKIIVLARDSFGNQGAGGDYVRVTLQSLNNSDDQVRAAIVVDRYDGSYDVEYTLSGAGLYRIDISINSKAIPNSPFNLIVQPAAPDSKNCRISGAGKDMLQKAGAGTQLSLQLVDSLGNNATTGGDNVVQFLVYVSDAPYVAPTTLRDSSTASSSGARRDLQPATSVLTNINDKGDGTYTLSYYAFEEGNYVFTILVHDEVIEGCPFNIKVDPVYVKYTGFPKETIVLLIACSICFLGVLGLPIICFPCRFFWHKIHHRRKKLAWSRFKGRTGGMIFHQTQLDKNRLEQGMMGRVKTFAVDELPDTLKTCKSIIEGYTELMKFIFFVSLFIFITLQQANPSTYFEINSSLRQTVGSTDGIKVFDDFWTFLDALLPAVFQDKWYNDDYLPPADQGFLNSYNKLVGGVQLVQTRGRVKECGGGSYSIFYGDCHGSEIDTEPFGGTDNSLFVFDADAGGHLAFFGVAQGKDGAVKSAANMKQNLWLDKNTRQVLIKFASFNGEQRLFNFVSISFSHSYGGIFAGRNKVEIQSIRMEPYVDVEDFILLAFEILYLYSFGKQFREEFMEMMTSFYTKKYRKYFTSVWNLIDWANIALAMSFITFRIMFLRFVYMNQIKIPTQRYEKALETASGLASAQQSMAAIFLMIAMVRLFKYFEFQDRMKIINLTLQKAFMDLIHFLILFFLVFAVFVALAYMIMGPHSEDYASYGSSMQMMAEIILGNFDFTTIGHLQPVIGGLFFWIYVFLVFFVLLNVFLAIIIDAYSDAKDQSVAARSIFEDASFGLRWASVVATNRVVQSDLGAHPFVAAREYFTQLGYGTVSLAALRDFFMNVANMPPSVANREIGILIEVFQMKQALVKQAALKAHFKNQSNPSGGVGLAVTFQSPTPRPEPEILVRPITPSSHDFGSEPGSEPDAVSSGLTPMILNMGGAAKGKKAKEDERRRKRSMSALTRQQSFYPRDPVVVVGGYDVPPPPRPPPLEEGGDGEMTGTHISQVPSLALMGESCDNIGYEDISLGRTPTGTFNHFDFGDSDS